MGQRSQVARATHFVLDSIKLRLSPRSEHILPLPKAPLTIECHRIRSLEQPIRTTARQCLLLLGRCLVLILKEATLRLPLLTDLSAHVETLRHKLITCLVDLSTVIYCFTDRFISVDLAIERLCYKTLIVYILSQASLR